MKIFVKAKAGAKEDKVTPPTAKLWEEASLDEYYKVSVKALPIQGKANDAIIKVLADYFKVPISCVVLLRGSSSKVKVFDIVGV